MTIDQDVFLSLLALDSYNRGYGANVGGLLEDEQIGEATLTTRASIFGDSTDQIYQNWQSAGFYAIAYNWNGQTIISYRGTNFPSEFTLSEFVAFYQQDFGGGWDIFTGIGSGSHAVFARDFYEAVTGFDFVQSDSDPIATNITLTGHSLGGALAGYVASRTFASAEIFDPVPFGVEAYANAVSEAFYATFDEFNFTEASFENWVETAGNEILSLIIPGHSSPGQVFADRFAENISERAPYFGNIDGYSLDGEIARFIDIGQVTIGSALAPLGSLGMEQLLRGAFDAVVDEKGGVVTVDNREAGGLVDAVSLHSMSWLTMTLFGEKQWASEGGANDWEASFQYILPHTSDDTIGERVGLGEDTGEASAGDQMAAMIAYSLLEAGDDSTLVFGDSGIRALFNDADGLGLVVSRAEDALDDELANDIGKIIVEFAGLLSFNKVEQADFVEAKFGVIGAVGAENALRIDVSKETWSQYDREDSSFDYSSSEAESLVRRLLDEYIGEEADATREAFTEWLANTTVAQTGAGDEGEVGLIDNVVFTFGENQLNGVENVGGIYDGFQLLIGEDSNAQDGSNNSAYVNTAIGSPAIIISGNGDNYFVGTDEDDAFITGRGDDIFEGGAGGDFFVARDGSNTIYGGTMNRDDDSLFDEAIYADGIGTQLVRIEDDTITVNHNAGTDTVYDVERIEFVGGQNVRLSLGQGIAAGTTLTIAASGEQRATLIDAHSIPNGFGTTVDLDGKIDGIEDLSTGGYVRLEGFNTEIISGEGDDRLVDGSSEEKIINAGEGDDFINVGSYLGSGGWVTVDAAASVFAGAGVDVIETGSGDDFIVDRDPSPVTGDVQFEGVDPLVLTDVVGAIRSGAGDDIIVLANNKQFLPADYELNSGFGEAYYVEAGQGDDILQVDASGYEVDYKYNRGDGSDSIRITTSSSLQPVTYYYDEIEGDIKTSAINLDLSDYSFNELSWNLSGDGSQILMQYAGSVSDLSLYYGTNASLSIQLADGGSINLNGLFSSRTGGDPGAASVSIRVQEGVFGTDLYRDRDSSLGETVYPSYVGTSQAILDIVNGGPVFSPSSINSSSSAIQSSQQTPSGNSMSTGSGTTGTSPVVSSTASLSLSNAITIADPNAANTELTISWALEDLEIETNGNSIALRDKWGLTNWQTFTGFNNVYTAEDGETLDSSMFVAQYASVSSEPGVELIDPADDFVLQAGEIFQLDVSQGIFSDVAGVSYFVTLDGGAPLPAWIVFDGVNIIGDSSGIGAQALSVQVTAFDGRFSATDIFNLTVQPSNSAPILAIPLVDKSVLEDAPISFLIDPASFTDDDGDVLTLSATQTNGSELPSWLSFDGVEFSGSPPQDFNGSIEITVTARDGTASVSDSFTLAISPVNDAPVAVDDIYNLSQGAALGVTALAGVLANDSDPDGDAVFATIDSDVSDGTLVLNADGSFDYTPNAHFVGADTFTYALNDGQGGSAIGSVALFVSAAANSSPIGVADSYSATEDTVLSISDPANGLLANDSDPDSDPLTASLIDGVANGILILNPNGTFDYTPDANFNGLDSFTYNVGDGSNNDGPITVSISVAAENDTPVAIVDAYTTTRDVALNVNALAGVLANDSDIDGDAITVSLDTDVSNGILALNADGSFDYTPNVGFFGTDSFTYTASDGQSSTSAQSVTLTVSQTAANIVNGGSGDDILQGISGDDIITGFAGSDTFKIFAPANGVSDGIDTITDFTNGEDIVQLNDIGGEVVEFVQNGNDVSLNVGGIQIALFENADASDVLRETEFGGSPSTTKLIIGGVQQNLVTMGTQGGDNIEGAPGITNHIIGLGGDDVLSGRGRPDILEGGAGNDNLQGSNSSDQLFGGDDDDLLFGANGSDLLEGGGGDDIIDGGRGDDTLEGGAGMDQFIFNNNFGDDIIIDFEVGIDIIAFAGAGFADFNAVVAAMSDTTNGVLIDDGYGDTIVLQGLVITDLSSADFTFA